MGGVVNILVRQIKGDDLAVAGINANVQLAPGAALCRAMFFGSSRILVGKKPGCDVAMSHNFQWLFWVFKGLKTGHDFGHEKTA